MEVKEVSNSKGTLMTYSGYEVEVDIVTVRFTEGKGIKLLFKNGELLQELEEGEDE